MSSSISFSKDEIKHIDKKLSPVIFNWADTLIMHILSQARNNGVGTVYMNTSSTLDAGSINEGKKKYFYETLPPRLGFKKESVNLRDQGDETLWAYHLDVLTSSISPIIDSLIRLSSKEFSLEELPKKYQGAFLGIIGRKPSYSEDDIRKVLSILEGKSGEKKPYDKASKVRSRFFYDWNSRTHSSSQVFRKDIVENVVLQKMTQDMRSILNSDDILRKFWSYLLSQSNHFGPDVVGFGLISKVSRDKWVINEIQTDSINAYLDLRSKALNWKEFTERDEREGLSWDSVRDMLGTNNRSKWIPKAEMSEDFKNQLMSNPDIINQLPDDAHDIDAWISEQQAGMTNNNRGLDLIRHFNSVNFSCRVIRTY